MFRGSFEHTLDNKGRLSIPSKFRDVLVGKGDERIVMTNFVIDSQRCLDVYPIDAWLRFEEEVRKKPKFDPRMVRFQNYYLGSACECTVDTHGRILIPPVLRKYADLKRDVILVSALEKFRVWDREAWKKIFVEAEDKLMQDPDFLGDLGLRRRKRNNSVGAKGAERMLARKPIQDISVIDLTGDIDFREMIRIKDVIGSLIEKDRTKVVLNLKSVDHINYLSIGLLLERLKLLRNLNGDLKLAGMS